MQPCILGIGALALLDDEPERRLEQLERLFSSEEFAAWRIDFDSGRCVFVRLRLFATLAQDGGVARHDNGEIDSVQFARPHGNDNLEHAREAIPMALEDLAGTLHEVGIEITADRLNELPMTIELDRTLSDALHTAHDS